MNERASIGAAGGDAMIDEVLEPGGDHARRWQRDCSTIRRCARSWLEFYVRSKGIENAGLRIKTTLSKGGLPGPEASLAKLVAGSR